MKLPCRPVRAATLFAAAGLLAINTPRAPAQPCFPAWVSNSGLPGANAIIVAATLWDPDGPGPADPLDAVGGGFSSIGGVPAPGIAAWDLASNQWYPLDPPGSGWSSG